MATTTTVSSDPTTFNGNSDPTPKNITYSTRYSVNFLAECEPYRQIPTETNNSILNPNTYHKPRRSNRCNLVEIPTASLKKNESKNFAYVPTFFLSNVMSLAPKIDEVRDVVRRGNYQFMGIVETWLQNHIHDNVINIHGYNLIRRDRINGQHGGVCMYIENSIKFKEIKDISNDLFEVLWISMYNRRLPRGFNNLVIGCVYHPPNADGPAMQDYLSNSLSTLESRFSNCGFIILGDFNKLNVSRLKHNYNLRQLVSFPTRGQNTLDLVLTNLYEFYDQPVRRAPFGLSDHMSVEVKPKERCQLPKARKLVVKRRDLRPSSRLAYRKYLELLDISNMYDKSLPCSDKVSLLESIVTTGLDFILPLISTMVRCSEPRWITSHLSKLIKKRQKYLNQGNLPLFKYYRNKVNRERKICRAKYYENSVRHLKHCKPSSWWTEVKKLSGSKPTCENGEQIFKALRQGEEFTGTSKVEVANQINDSFLSPMAGFTPLTPGYYVSLPNAKNVLPIKVSPEEVFKKLTKLNSKKAHGPDGIPTWVLKENADLFESIVADILNSTFRELHVPPSWKEADIVAIPKTQPIHDINNHLRPISLTPILSKLAEDFVVERHLKPAIMARIDNKQFGTISHSSTTHALISMLHSWNKSTDGNGSTNRIMLFDYRKAFDMIDHQILANKLTKYDIPNPTLHWILDFLTTRKQRVKLSNDCFSEWKTVPAGVPQGTKLGPWLFLVMMNDLDVSGDVSIWKYVDDSTMSEIIDKGKQSALQSHVNEFALLSMINGMQLKESKCKELRICFSNIKTPFVPVIINDKEIEVVSKAKLLGLTISNDLKWNAHIENTSKKVSSRLYFLRQLKRTKLPSEDLLLFYITCIRPCVEYGCEVFHDSLPKYLSDDLEKLQKRACKIIHPELGYEDALKELKLLPLSVRRDNLTSKFFSAIVNDPNNKLHNLLPPLNPCNVILREKRKFLAPNYKTVRFKNDFITFNSSKYLDSN